MLASSWRAPAAGSRLSSRSSCASVSWIASAAVFSSTRATRRVPGIGAMSSPRVRIHASAVCAGVAPISAPIARTSSTSARLRRKFSPVNRGLVLRQSSSAKSSTERICPGEQAVAERRVGDEADPELAQQRQDLRLHVAGPQRVLGLKRGDRLHGVCAADGLGGGLGEAEVQHLALGDQVGDGLRGLLDRGVRVDAVLVEQVDVVGAQALERPFDRGLDVRGTAVDHAGAAAGVGDEPELRGDLDLVTAALDGLADDLLAQERPVDLSRVDVGDAEIEAHGGWCGSTPRCPGRPRWCRCRPWSSRRGRCGRPQGSRGVRSSRCRPSLSRSRAVSSWLSAKRGSREGGSPCREGYWQGLPATCARV